MNPEDFELEKRIRSLSINEDSNNEMGLELAELIANCVADVEPHDCSDEDAEVKNHSPNENDGDLPKSLIVTNLPGVLFTDQQLKLEFEALFRTYEDTATFHYLKSFRRARVDFRANETASRARVHLHQTPIGDNLMNCFFGQPPVINKNTQQFLQIPPPVRQFLISPPASPPVDWASGRESEPVLNFDLLSAIASLGPGDEHELLAATGENPGIVVHICSDDEGIARKGGVVIGNTPCPKRN